ncbi:MAG: arsenosugar biosynthesis-associated peroxidase-like protein [Myxococcota bacterium]
MAGPVNGYYDRAHLPRFPEIGEGQKALADAFFRYYGQVFRDGALSVREKALMALSVAHAVQCPYCIDAYTSGSLEAGADLEQMTEAVHVASVVRSASVMAYGTMMLGQARQIGMGGQAVTVNQAYFDRGHLGQRDALVNEQPKLGLAFRTWEAATYAEGALSAREKRLIALSCAHAIQCPYSIDDATASLNALGATLPELTEAVHVANAIRGGAALVHGVQMLDQVHGKTF